MPVPSTGQVVGSVTGTFINFPYSQQADVYLRPGPMNSGTAWVISVPGSIGYPILPGDDPLVLKDVDDLSVLRGWFEKAGDRIQYLIMAHDINEQN